MHPIAQALNSISDELNATYLERAEAIEGMILATLAGEHAFLLGPPGTAKSALVRSFVHSITGARYFEVGLSKNRPPEAVLGPLDIPAFRETGAYRLKREGYASQVEFLFLDEGGKMSPILGHDLLPLLNERIYHEVNGKRSVHASPLSSAFVASNEEITGESDDAAAMWDRLLVRVVVDYLKEPASFAGLLSGSVATDPETTIAWDDLKEVIDNVVPEVKVPEDTLASLIKLRKGFAAEHLYPSDRRWRASVKVLQAHAFLAGRDEVLDEDLVALRMTLWDTVEQIDKVHRLCGSAANPLAEPMFKIRESLSELDAELQDRIKEAAGQDDPTLNAFGKELFKKLKGAADEMRLLHMQAAGKPIPQIDQAIALHRSLMVQMGVHCQGLDEDGAELVASKYEVKLEGDA